MTCSNNTNTIASVETILKVSIQARHHGRLEIIGDNNTALHSDTIQYCFRRDLLYIKTNLADTTGAKNTEKKFKL